MLPSLLTWPWGNAFPLKTPQPFWKTVTEAARYAELGFFFLIAAAGDGTGVVERCKV